MSNKISSQFWFASFAFLLPSSFILSSCVQSSIVQQQDITNRRPSSSETMPAVCNDPSSGSACWTPCALLRGTSDTSAQCGSFKMPLDWNQPDGAQISIAVKRVLGTAHTATPHKQIWVIEGGPGSCGELEATIQMWSQVDPASDFYYPDHRGVGGSEKLICPNTESTTAENGPFDWHNQLPADLWNKCIAEIADKKGSDYLSHFTVTNAAKDIAKLIELTRTQDQEVHVYGGSYGTGLVQRYLQVAPGQATSAILSSFSNFGVWDLVNWDVEHNKIGKIVFDACGADPICSSKLGTKDKPWATLGETLKTIQKAPNEMGCAGFKYDHLRGALALFSDNYAFRDLLPALVYRIHRCSAEDVNALSGFRAAFFSSVNGSQGHNDAITNGSSEVLQNVIITSEMITLPPESMATATEKDAELYYSAKMGLNFVGMYSNGFKDKSGEPAAPYPHDSFFGHYSSKLTPMLLFNGTLDPSTPIIPARKVAQHYTGPYQHFVEIPRAGHEAIKLVNGKPNCAMAILQNFINNPKGNLDTSCISTQIPQFNFSHQGDPLAFALFCTGDIWEGVPDAQCVMNAKKALGQ